MSGVRGIHPFPARMAPELAVSLLDSLPADSFVLDPLCGSGTVLRYAAERGLRSCGVDIDPLAVKMSQTWSAPPEMHALLHDATVVLREAESAYFRSDNTQLPWHDPATERFAKYWFGEKQREQLAALSRAIMDAPSVTRTALEVALSRI